MRSFVARGVAVAALILAACGAVSAADRTQVLHVPSRAPQLVIGPADAERMTVTVRGVTYSVGRAYPVGGSYLGHVVVAQALPRDLRPDEPIVVRVTPAGLPAARMIAADDDVRAAVDAARAGGFMLGVLVIVVLLQLVTFVMTRESSIPWYVGLVACLAAIALTMDGVSPFPPGAPALLCLDLAAMICAAGFVVAYLRLWSQARALFWAVAASCGASIAVGIVGVIVSVLRTQAESLRVPLVCAFCVAMFAVIVIRARRFTPAWILLGGTSLLIASSTYRALRAHIGVPFLDRWAFDIGATLDAIIFASAIVARVRYAISDRRAIERRLTEATYEASHDPLTGALNRRGLFASTSLSRGTLVAVDLDGFKAVNDRYGHGAGDAVLKDVTAALRDVVPSGLVARIGGDEFVLVTGEDDQRSGEMLADAIADAVANVRCAGHSNHDGITITASVGCASLDGRSLEAALRIADASAYLMKAMRRAEAS